METMSESFIQLPPDSTGKRVRALRRIVDDVEVYERAHFLTEPRSGEPIPSWYPTYSATVLASAVAANKHHLVLFNGSTRVIRVSRVYLHPETTAAVTGFIMGYRLIRTTSAGAGGTSVTVNKMDTSDPDLPSGVVVWTNPTTAPALGPVIAAAATNPEETGGTSFPAILYEWKLWEKPLTLRPGEGITVQQYGTAGVGLIDVVVIFQVI